MASEFQNQFEHSFARPILVMRDAQKCVRQRARLVTTFGLLEHVGVVLRDVAVNLVDHPRVLVTG